jgi:hypothetical protein
MILVREFYTYSGILGPSLRALFSREKDMLRASRTIQDAGGAEMDDLRQMQNSIASELPLQQPLRDLTNVVPGGLHLD